MFPQRYLGTRWQLIFGAYAGMEETAVNVLQQSVQRYLPYVPEVRDAEAATPSAEESCWLLVGTPASNRWIAELTARGVLELPAEPESFTITCADAPWPGVTRMLVIAGRDAKGVLNGVYDFEAQVLSTRLSEDVPGTARALFDALPDLHIAEAPLVHQRGLWSWGYVIYDYRRYLDHMARLKMNTLVVWFDVPPQNLRRVLDYAAARGIKVIVGYPWGWGDYELPDLLDPATRARVKAEILRHYRTHYQQLPIDGIYFQTCTEHNDKFLGERSTAEITCEWVNDVARDFFAEDPELQILFGLHATSILERYTDYRDLDPRVTIMWEDAGVLPYTYGPTLENPKHEYATFDATLAYSRQLVCFRPENTHFAMVPKGWMCLRWDSEFEHHGPFIMGERSPEYIRRRLEERQANWDKHNDLWLALYPYAARFYREMLDRGPSRMTVAGLVEDGLFEERIQLCAALFAETLWNPRRSDAELLRRAMSPYYLRE